MTSAVAYDFTVLISHQERVSVAYMAAKPAVGRNACQWLSVKRRHAVLNVVVIDPQTRC